MGVAVPTAGASNRGGAALNGHHGVSPQTSARASLDAALSDLDTAVRALTAAANDTVMINDDLSALLLRVTSARRLLDDAVPVKLSSPPASLR